MKSEHVINAISRRIVATFIDRKQWRKDMTNLFKTIHVPNQFSMDIHYGSNDTQERACAFFKYTGKKPSNWKIPHNASSIAVDAWLSIATGDWTYQINWFAGENKSINEKKYLFKSNEFNKVKESLKSVFEIVFRLSSPGLPDDMEKDKPDENSMDDETPIENHTPVNGGWGQYDTFSYTGGSITPNLNNFDNDGYALEFTFDPYLEYDQHFRRGWDEKKIVERLKNFATLTKVGYAKNYYVFKAHSHNDIPKIMDVADAAGLLIKVPFKHN